MESPAAQLLSSLETATEKLVSEADATALAFSGGLDSSIIAFLLKNKCSISNCSLSLYVAGTENCRDFEAADRSARALSLPLTKIAVTESDVSASLPGIVKMLGTAEPLIVAIELPLYFVLKNSTESLIFTGQGADELFGGYHRYVSMKKDELCAAFENDIKTLLETGIKREMKLASVFGKELRYPFLDEEVINLARSIPPDMKISGGERKIILREVAAALGLPDFIVGARKTAAQYGSGIMKSLDRAARNNGKSLRDYIGSFSLQSP